VAYGQRFESPADLWHLAGDHRVVLEGYLKVVRQGQFRPNIFYAGDRFAVVPRFAAPAVFNTIDQFDCVLHAKACATRYQTDCLEGSRAYCSEAFAAFKPAVAQAATHTVSQSECRLTLHVHNYRPKLCVCNQFQLPGPRLMLNQTLNNLCALNQSDYDSAQATELAQLDGRVRVQRRNQRQRPAKSVAALNRQLKNSPPWITGFRLQPTESGLPVALVMPKCCALRSTD
jgi:hypothetical protein